MNWAQMSHHHKFLGLCLLRNWSLVNSFCIPVVVKGSSEGVTLRFDINWWTLKPIITLLGFGTAEIRKMNFRKWIHWKEMWLQSHYCWMLWVPWHPHRMQSGLLAAVKLRALVEKKRIILHVSSKVGPNQHPTSTVPCIGHTWELGLPYSVN